MMVAYLLFPWTAKLNVFFKNSVSVSKQNKFSIYSLKDTHLILSFIINDFVEPLVLNIFFKRVITYPLHN